MYICVIALLCVVFADLRAETPVSRLKMFNELMESEDWDGAKKVLDGWTVKDGDYYASQFNYYFNQSVRTRMRIAKKLPWNADEEEAMELQDTLSGEISGYMFQYYSVDYPLFCDSAMYWIRLGIKKFPNRLDLYLGQVSAYLLYGNAGGMIKVLDSALQQETVNNRDWLWMGDEKITIQEDLLFLRVQEDFNRFLNAEMYDEAELLVSMALRNYPKRAEYANDMAAIYYMQGDYNKALMWFEKAYKLNPQDELIKENIEYVKLLLNK